MSETCDRCGSVGSDRRTLWMDCFYDMGELKIPFRREVLLDAEPQSLEPASPPVRTAVGDIVIDPGRVRCSGELTPQGFYTLRVCKRCRSEWMAAIKEWFGAAPGGKDYDADERDPEPECGSGIFVRDDGALREITAEEWERRAARAAEEGRSG